MDILLINGPNLNLLGTREPEIYGNKTLNDIEKELTKVAQGKSVKLECFQSNHEGEIVDKIQNSVKKNPRNTYKCWSFYSYIYFYKRCFIRIKNSICRATYFKYF